MAIKKSELYSSLWQSCDELRGGMDASQYKDYVLTLLFVKYVSDKYAGDPYAVITVPEGGSFADMVRLKGDKEIGDKMNKIIRALADANDLRGVIDLADFNDENKLGRGKEMVDRLSNLVGIFEKLDLSQNRSEGDDLLGDAYEYLMRNFATQSGKAKGQFYTPAEVSRVIAGVVGVNEKTQQDQTVYDPTCGSGSLLMKVADEAPNGLSIYGQEMDNATWALARMNMFLHGYPTHDLWRGNTLATPHWVNDDGSLKRFDFAVANPPFSYKSWTNGVNVNDDSYRRFEYSVPPTKNGDYAFLLHILASLKSTGKAAIILPHGVLFRGHSEADIRRRLITQGYIKGIIGLPPNLFYGTGIPACIIVLDKEGAAARDSIFMIDASRGFMKDGNKNRLRSRDIHKIVDVFNSQQELPAYSRLVSRDEIAQNEYNLNIPRYIDSSEPEDLHDLGAHLHGGIPLRDIEELADYWQVFPTMQQALFAENGRDGYREACVQPGQVKETILAHAEFVEFKQCTMARYEAWREAHHERLHDLDVGADVKGLIQVLAEDLLARFADVALVDKYAVYQLLMDYWAETMQDDVFVIAQEGWQAGGVLRELVTQKGQRSRETPDLKIGRKKYKADLIPPELIVSHYFAQARAELERLQAELDSMSQELEALSEEHGSEDGLLAEALSDAGNVTKGNVNARLKELKREKAPPDDEELVVMRQVKKLMDAEYQAKKDVRAQEKKLDKLVFAQYPKLSVAEIQTLVIEEKWLATLAAEIEAEIERVTQRLADRVGEVVERYNEPLPVIVDEIERLSERVEGHLIKLGATV